MFGFLGIRQQHRLIAPSQIVLCFPHKSTADGKKQALLMGSNNTQDQFSRLSKTVFLLLANSFQHSCSLCLFLSHTHTHAHTSSHNSSKPSWISPSNNQDLKPRHIFSELVYTRVLFLIILRRFQDFCC